MDRETRARMLIRSRAWDLGALLPEGLDPKAPLEELCGRDDIDIVVVVRRRAPPGQASPGPGPGPPAISTLPLGPMQRFLPNCFLSDAERHVVEILLEHGVRMTRVQLLDRLEERLGAHIGEFKLKAMLARMTDPVVGILDNRRTCCPPGYSVTAEYREFFLWVVATTRAQAEEEARRQPA